MKITELLSYLLGHEVDSIESIKIESIKRRGYEIEMNQFPIGSDSRAERFDKMITASFRELESSVRKMIVSDILIMLLEEKEIND